MKHPRLLSPPRGFSLVELMVVLALIAILTAMILPEMKGTWEDALLRSASRKLVSVFHLASSRAIAVNQPHRVRLQARNGRYVVESRAPEGNRATGFVPLEGVPGSDGKLDPRISIELRRTDQESPQGPEPTAPVLADADAHSNPPSPQGSTGLVVAFYGDGTADPAEILLRDRQGFRMGLRIHATTARIEIVELERE